MRGAHAFEGFDDDHPAATTEAAAPRRRSFGVKVLEVTVRLSGRAFGRGERLADALDVAGSNRSGKQAVVWRMRWKPLLAARAGESGG